MSQRLKAISLVAANIVCLTIAIAIVFYAILDWPTRYHNHTLSWSVTAFFVAFVGLAVLGSAATAIYLRGRSGQLVTRVAMAPVALLAIGLMAGAAKALLTGDF